MTEWHHEQCMERSQCFTPDDEVASRSMPTQDHIEFLNRASRITNMSKQWVRDHTRTRRAASPTSCGIEPDSSSCLKLLRICVLAVIRIAHGYTTPMVRLGIVLIRLIWAQIRLVPNAPPESAQLLQESILEWS